MKGFMTVSLVEWAPPRFDQAYMRSILLNLDAVRYVSLPQQRLAGDPLTVVLHFSESHTVNVAGTLETWQGILGLM